MGCIGDKLVSGHTQTLDRRGVPVKPSRMAAPMPAPPTFVQTRAVDAQIQAFCNPAKVRFDPLINP